MADELGWNHRTNTVSVSVPASSVPSSQTVLLRGAAVLCHAAEFAIFYGAGLELVAAIGAVGGVGVGVATAPVERFDLVYPIYLICLIASSAQPVCSAPSAQLATVYMCVADRHAGASRWD